jgi:uncharacterized OB-fold protein
MSGNIRDEDFFWEGAQTGRLLVQKCADCGRLRHPPAPMCARCQSVEVEIVECSGRAKVLGWFLSKHPTQPDSAPRMVVRLQLEEGTYLVANLQGVGLEDMSVGMPVQVFFEQVGDFVVPQCRSVERAAA